MLVTKQGSEGPVGWWQHKIREVTLCYHPPSSPASRDRRRCRRRGLQSGPVGLALIGPKILSNIPPISQHVSCPFNQVALPVARTAEGPVGLGLIRLEIACGQTVVTLMLPPSNQVTLPVARTAEGPVGLGLIGPRGADEALLEFAEAAMAAFTGGGAA